MKKYVLPLILFGSLAFTGCSKDWSCKCEVYADDQLIEDETTIEVIEGKKDEALLDCNEKDNAQVIAGIFVETECDIEK